MRRTRFIQTHDEGHANNERWLLTYADMITLLTAFFLMLYSMSVMSKGKFTQLATSVRSGFGGVVQGGTHILPVGSKGLIPSNGSSSTSKPYEDAMKNLSRYVEQHHLSGQITTRSDERGVVISLIADHMLFERGQAQLGPNSQEALSQVTQILKTVPNVVQIEGHTCDLPIHTAQFPSNWELSTARAAAILRYFTTQENLPNDRFMAAGYAETHPLMPNTSETNRAHNRRVDIVILKSDAQRQQELARQGEIKRIIAPP